MKSSKARRTKAVPSADERVFTVRLSAKGLAGLTVDRRACSDIDSENALAPPPPKEVRATVAVSNGSMIVGKLPVSSRLRPAPTETVVVRANRDEVDMQSVTADDEGTLSDLNRYVSLWYDKQSTLSFDAVLPVAKDGSAAPKKYELFVGLQHDTPRSDVLPVGVALLFISADQAPQKIVDLTVYPISHRHGSAVSGFEAFSQSEEKKDDDMPILGSAYSLDATGDTVFRLEVEVTAKQTALYGQDNVVDSQAATRHEERFTDADLDWDSVEVLSDVPSVRTMEPSIELPIDSVTHHFSSQQERDVSRNDGNDMKPVKRPLLPPKAARQSKIRMTPRRPSAKMAKNIVVPRSASSTGRWSVGSSGSVKTEEEKQTVTGGASVTSRKSASTSGSASTRDIMKRPPLASSPRYKRSSPRLSNLVAEEQAVEVAVVADTPEGFVKGHNMKRNVSSGMVPGSLSRPPKLKQESSSSKQGLDTIAKKNVEKTETKTFETSAARATGSSQVKQSVPSPTFPEQKEKTPPRRNSKKPASNDIFSFEFEDEASTVWTEDKSRLTRNAKSASATNIIASKVLGLMGILPTCGRLGDVVGGVVRVDDDEDTLFDLSDVGEESITVTSASRDLRLAQDEISATMRPEDAFFDLNLCRAPDRDDLSDLMADLRLGDSYERRKERWKRNQQMSSVGEDSMSYVDDMTSAYSSVGSMKGVVPKNADNETWDGSTLPTLENTLRKTFEDDGRRGDAMSRDVESTDFLSEDGTEDDSPTTSTHEDEKEVAVAQSAPKSKLDKPATAPKTTKVTGLAVAGSKEESATHGVPTPAGKVEYFKAVEEPPAIERVGFLEKKDFDPANKVKGPTQTTTKSPKSLLEFPSPAEATDNDSMPSLSNSFMKLVSCGGVHPEDQVAMIEGGIPAVVDPDDEDSIGDLTLTSYEMRIDLERYKQKLQAAKQLAEERAKAENGARTAAWELERGNSLSTAKQEDYFKEYKAYTSSQIDDAAQAAMAKQEFNTSLQRGARLRLPRRKVSFRAEV